MYALVDSHVHLDDLSFEVDRDAVLARGRAAGVIAQILPGVDAASWPRIQQCCETHRDLYPAYGLHPMFIAQHRPEHLDMLADRLRSHRPVALGEIGLDFYIEDLPAEPQRHYFSRQLELAREFDLPVIVHARRALEEVTLMLRRIGGLRGVVHSFSGSAEQARQLWQLGFHLGIGGPVTYERAQRLRQIVAQMPLQFLLLETDAPDQPDAAHRGQRNEPARIVEVLQSVAQLRNEDPHALADATTANARKLFGLG
ncbi:TatD family deoxyribonuclease [Dyella tabacisoli]|uniref:TatD family deoxyribonuclease n=2 Tax=Dyella tabacisoli TaxID=2282381 RepID=A0A369UKM5_9GAMM|nr:TatD family deoxyribonuclease [Dyella tabacisoli]